MKRCTLYAVVAVLAGLVAFGDTLYLFHLYRRHHTTVVHRATTTRIVKRAHAPAKTRTTTTPTTGQAKPSGGGGGGGGGSGSGQGGTGKGNPTPPSIVTTPLLPLCIQDPLINTCPDTERGG